MKMPIQRLLQVLKWVARVTLWLIATVCALAIFLSMTSTGARLVIRRALVAYDDQVEGAIEVEAIDGTLLAELRLGHVVLRDAAGAPLATARQVDLDWSPLALLDGELRVASITLREAHLFLPGPGAAGFADLAPEPQAPPSPALGPDLPLKIDAQVHLEGAHVHAAAPGQPAWASDVHLSGHLTGAGQTARLVVRQGRGALPALGARVSTLVLDAAWASPHLTVAHLRGTTDLGRVRALAGALDFAAGRLEARADVHAARAALEARLPNLRWPGDPDVQVRVAGTLADFELAIAGRAGPSFQVQGRGALRPRPALDADVTLDGVRLADFVPFDVEGGLRGHVRVDGKDLATMSAAVDLTCVGCRAPTGPFDLRVRGTLDRGSGAAQVTGRLAGTELDVELTVVDLVPTSARGRVRVKDLAILRSWVKDLPPLGGALDAQAECTGAGESLVCAVKATGQRLRGPDVTAASARLNGTVRPLARPIPVDARLDAQGVTWSGRRFQRVRAHARGHWNRFDVELDARTPGGDTLVTELLVEHQSPWRVKVKRLEASVGGVKAEVHDPTTLAFDGGRIQVRGLKLAIDGGRIEVDGVLGPGRPADLTVHVTHVPIALLARLAKRPPPAIDGIVDAHLRLTGGPRDPSLRLEATLTDLVWRPTGATLADAGAFAEPRPLGRLTIEGRLERGQLFVEGRLVGAPARHFAFDADVPLTVDLARYRFELRPAAPVLASVTVEALDALAVRALLSPEARAVPAIARVDATLEMTGTLVTPRIDANVAVHDLVYDDRPLGDIDVAVSYADRRVGALMTAKGPIADRFDGRLDIPLIFEPMGGGVKWVREGPHGLEVTLEKLHLRAIRPWVRGLRLRGDFDFHATADGTPEDPRLSATLDGREVRWRGRPIGMVRARLGYEDEGAHLDVRVSPGEGRSAAFTANVPFLADVRAGRFEWRPEAPHTAVLVLRDVDGAMLAPLVELPESLVFALNGGVRADGTLADFTAQGHVGATLKHGDLGESPLVLDFLAKPSRQLLSLALGGGLDAQAEVAVDLRAPLLALARGEAKFEDTPIRAAFDIPHLNLAPFGPLLPTAVFGPEGVLTTDLQAEGVVGYMMLSGAVEVRDGALTIVDLNQRLKDVQLKMRADGRDLLLESLRFTSGRGEGRASGQARWDADGTLRGEVALALDDMPFQRPGLPSGHLGTRVETDYWLGPDRIALEVRLRKTTFEMRGPKIEAPKPVPKNDNVVHVRARGRVIEEDEEVAPPRPLRVRLDVSDPIRIGGRGLEMRWQGQVVYVLRDGVGQAEGGLQSLGGQVDALGNTFELEHGLVTLTADGDPWLDVAASTQVDTYTVNVSVRGRASAPLLTLTSDPPLPQYQVLQVLLLGDPGGSDDPTHVEREAAALLAAVQSPVLEQQLNDRLGIDRVGVSFGETVDEPILTLGKRVTRDIYVETAYHVNAPPEQNETEVRVEYRFAPRWSLESRYGDAGQGAVDVVWRITFGGSAVATPREPAPAGTRSPGAPPTRQEAREQAAPPGALGSGGRRRGRTGATRARSGPGRRPGTRRRRHRRGRGSPRPG